jgi:RHH-type rel operon transcriptional repressor/antitoxin RelB
LFNNVGVDMLGIRLNTDMEQELAAVARKQGRSKSDVARDAIRRYLAAEGLFAEARRQSLLVSASEHDREVADFILLAADAGDGG